MRLRNHQKYNNKTVIYNGEKYDSKNELNRCMELRLLEKAGKIKNLQRQVKYELMPSQKMNGKTIERPVVYIADFVYEENGQSIVEDVKGMKTKDYIIKRKLMLFLKGIKIRETSSRK